MTARLVRFACFVFVTVDASAGCGTAHCNFINDCQAPLVVDANIPLAVVATDGLSLTFCRNGGCFHGALSGAAATLEGPFEVGVAAKGAADGSTDVVFTPAFAGFVDGSGDVADGDEYEVRIADGATVLLDNTRKIDFNHGSAGCRSGSCYEARYTVTPASASNIECHSNGCPFPVVTMSGTLSTSDVTPVTVVACRNGACATGSTTLPPTANQDAVPDTPEQQILTVLLDEDIHNSGATTFATTLETFATPPEGFHDGDTYWVTVTHGAATLLDWAQTVTHDKTFPNGPQCDLTPCTSATITL